MLAATTVGNYALFGGGSISWEEGSSTVDSYSAYLVHGTLSPLSKKRRELAATTVVGYGLFGGGEDGDAIFNTIYLSTVDAYSASLVRSTPTALSQAKSMLAATTVGNYGLFGGGYGGSFSSTVDAYTADGGG